MLLFYINTLNTVKLSLSFMFGKSKLNHYFCFLNNSKNKYVSVKFKTLFRIVFSVLFYFLMLKLFKSKNPLVVIIYPIIAFVFLYFNPETYGVYSSTPYKPLVYKQLMCLIDGAYGNTIYIILSVIFLTVVAFFFNHLIRNLKILKSFQNLHGFIFLLLTGFCIRFIDILQISISILFFLITITLIIKSLRKDFAHFDFFNAGLALSAASLFRFQIIWFYPIIIIGILVFRKLNFREILTSLIGLFIPYFFFFSIYFFVHSDFNIIYDTYQLIITENTHFPINLNLSIFGFFLIAILLISVFHVLRKYKSTESDIQDYYIFWFLLFLLASVYLVFFYKNDYSFIIIMMMSAAVPLGVYFSETKRPLAKEIIFDLFLLAVILSQFDFFT